MTKEALTKQLCVIPSCSGERLEDSDYCYWHAQEYPEPTPRVEALTSNLRFNGVSRAADDGEPFSQRVVELHFNRQPTDDELRALHVYMRYFSDDSSAPETSVPTEHVHSWDGEQCHYCHFPKRSYLALECERLATLAKDVDGFTSDTLKTLVARNRGAQETSPDEECTNCGRVYSLHQTDKLICPDVAEEHRFKPESAERKRIIEILRQIPPSPQKASPEPPGHRIDCGVLNNPLSSPCTCGYNALNGKR